jgi:photosystem II stability/assembly factor-like uncharacterized protein
MRVIALTLLLVSAGLDARAHDPSTYGGLFRSRNLGGTWLNADVGLFLNAALTVAVDPRDPNHLLMGTDTGVLGSSNGGRSWTAEGQGLVYGPVFAVAFSPDGETALCVAPGGVFRFREGRWLRAAAPEEAAPARSVIFGAAPGRVYLLGHGGFFISDDQGERFRRAHGPAENARIAALAIARQPREVLFAVIDGKLMASEDGGERWQPRTPGPVGASVNADALDPLAPNRLWAASADQIYVSDDLGVAWRAVGKPLPEAQTDVRGIAADETGSTLVVTTHRGLYRSEDGGAHWQLKESNLPVHLEAGPLVRDPRDPQTLYAVYSLMPYAVVWRTALEGGNLLSRVDVVSLAGGLAFVLLLLVSGALLVVWLERRRGTASAARGSFS